MTFRRKTSIIYILDHKLDKNTYREREKVMKKVCLLFTTVVMIMLFALSANALELTGQCGENVYWIFDNSTGELVVSGAGPMTDYELFDDDNPFSFKDIRSVVIGDGVTSIGDYTFSYEKGITSVIIPESVTSIGDYAFIGCEKLESLTIPDSVISIGDAAFWGCEKLESLTIPDSVISIGDSAFQDCENITSITLGSNIETIGEEAFYRCKKLERITIPDSVISIGHSAFSYCPNLADVAIGKGVVSVDDFAFAGCNLKSITIPDNVAYIGTAVFYATPLEGIIVDENNAAYSNDENGVLYNKDKTVLLEYPSGNKNTTYTIPESVTSIRQRAFVFCNNLESIVIPGTVETVSQEAFLLCLKLSEVIISDGVSSVESMAFVNNQYLDSITIEDMDVDLGENSIGANTYKVVGLEQEEFINHWIRVLKSGADVAVSEELEAYLVYTDDMIHIGKIYCHAGSTAEAYAVENNVDYELIHFYKGEWTYDYEQMIRFRKCIHCDALEIENLETIESGDVEIVAPIDPDADFEVDEIEKTGDSYLLIKEAVTNSLGTEWDVLKAFDITFKNKDGVHVQPDGTVKVKLPLDWEKEGDYKVYRVNDDGTLTDMNAYRQGSHMVFDTNHFSVYVIVEERVQEEPEAPTNEESPFDFFTKIINWFKELIEKIIKFFRSIGV